MIKNIEDLADIIGCKPHRIAKALLNYTDSGLCFSEYSTGVSISGYCEGTDMDCTVYHLVYPFAEEAFWSAVDRADEDCRDLWNATHGCEHCWPNGCIDDQENLYDPGEAGGPVNPDCTHCEGEGIIF